MEYKMLQLKDEVDVNNAHHFVVKGMNEKYNYLVTDERFYDL